MLVMFMLVMLASYVMLVMLVSMLTCQCVNMLAVNMLVCY